MNSTFTDIALSAPINRVARRVTSPGIRHDIEIKQGGGICQKLPLPLLKDTHPFDYRMAMKDPCWVDFTGVRWGHFLVIGPSAKSGRSRGSRWVLRCACGNYTTRSARTLKKDPNPADGKCRECLAKERIWKRYARLQRRREERAWAAANREAHPKPKPLG